MLKQLKRLFQASDPLIELARSGEAALFALSFIESELFVVSIPVARSLAPAAVSGLRPFTYGPEGDESLPVFSSEETAEEFVKGYVRAANRVIPFVIAGLRGAALLPLLSARRLSVVLNPLADSEYELPRDLVSALEALGMR